jgi:hypothetical protein
MTQDNADAAHIARGGTYRIVRYSQNGPREVLYEGLTFDEVRAHCNNPATQGQGWFDGFEREE